MTLVETSDIWGIGPRLAKRLSVVGIHNALQFCDAPPRFVRDLGSVQLLRTQSELRGQICFELESQASPKKQIVCSRSFGNRVTELNAMREAVGSYTSRACEKLRKEGQVAQHLTVFIRTSAFSDDPFYSRSANARLPCSSDDTRDFMKMAMALLNGIWKPNYAYAKAGVMLSDFYPRGQAQLDFFQTPADHSAQGKLMETMDLMNQRGLGKIFFARQGMQQAWKNRRSQLSPRYTTCWKDIPCVR